MKKQSFLKAFSILFILALSLPVFAQPLATNDPAQLGMSAERLERLTQTFQQYVDENEISGGVICVSRKGQVAYFEAFGLSDMENQRPMEKDAIFRIASQTKALVSTGIMLLQEEGKLLISDPVSKYIPEFKTTTVAVPTEDGGYTVEKAKRAITLRDLLTHTSGIGYGGGLAKKEWAEAGFTGWYFANSKEPILERVRKMPAIPFETQPGEKFVYGYNTDILGAVIEVVSGQPLNFFLQKRILEPLDMHDTHFYLPKAKKDRLAVVYSSTDNGIVRAPDKGTMEAQGAYVSGPRTCFSGGAGLLSTAEDYTKFLLMLLNEGKGNGQQILSRKSVELMTCSHLKNIPFPEPGNSFGLGFRVTEDLGTRGVLGSEGEFGWGGAYHSTYWVDPKEELTVVYFTQLIPARVDDHQKLRALIYQALTEE